MISNKHFHLLVPVWGEIYTKLFIDVCLPFLMTPGNIAALDNRTGNQFVIITTWEDYLTIRNSPNITRIKNLIEVEFIIINGLVDITNSHAAMSECYRMAMQRKDVVPGETCFLFLTPDSFWPDGTFRRLVELADQDFKVVMAAGIRVNSEPMSAIMIDRIIRFPDNPAIPLPELIQLVLANMHQLSLALNMFSKMDFLNQWPSHLYWINEPDKQLIAHCFHLHPLLVLAPKSKTTIGTTIDGEFLKNLPYRINQYYVIQSEYFGIELSPTNRNWGQPLGPPSISQIVRFSLFHANSRHWYFFSKGIVLNGNPKKSLDPALEKLAENIVSRILRYRMLAIVIQKLRVIFFLNVFGAGRWKSKLLNIPKLLFGHIRRKIF